MVDEPRGARPLEGRERRIHDRLQLLGEGPPAFYRRALDELRTDPPRDAASHIVGHAWREIESALCDVLEPLAGQRPSGGEAHRRKIEMILDALEISRDAPVARAWLALAGTLHGRAHRDDLAAPPLIDAAFRADWEAFEAVLDEVLARFEARYLDAVAPVPRLLLIVRPTAADMALLREHVPNNPVALGEFFEGLEHEGWLEPLREAGYFRRPPGRVYGSEGQSFRFPYWAQARYLRRMAERGARATQERVVEILLETEETDNDVVHVEFAEAALALPADLAARWAAHETHWVARRDWVFELLADRLAQVVAKLAASGEGEVAVGLARALLEPLPNPRAAAPPDPDAIFTPSPRPRSRSGDDHDYEHALELVLPALSEHLRDRATSMLADLLERAVRFGRVVERDGRSDDLSHAWRPAVEEHEQNVGTGVREALIRALRDALVARAEREPGSIPELVAELEARGLPIFRRLALHLLRVARDAPLELLSIRLTAPGADDIATWHEWSLLLHDRFGGLPAETQHAILATIDAGPDRASIREALTAERGAAPSDADVEAWCDWWQLRRYELIAPHLTGRARARYEALTALRGRVEHPDLLTYHTAWWGPRLPEETRTLGDNVDGWIDFAREYAPPRDELDAHEGASNALAGAVATTPVPFAEAAARFAGLRPPYVRAIFSGLEQAARAERSFPWPEVLSLAEWVLAQEHRPGPRARRFEEHGWTFTRHAILHLLSQCLTQGPTEIPIAERARVWQLIAALAEDPEPTPEDEVRAPEQPLDLQSFALGATRSRALWVAVQYGVWVDRHVRPPDRPEPRTFDQVPELRELLERHLDAEGEPSVAVRAVYGEWYLALRYLDVAWTRAHQDAIFPEDPRYAHLGDAAWEPYLDASEPRPSVFADLRPQYATAVERIGAPARFRWTTPPAHRLADHLLVLAVAGAIALDDPLLARYHELAPAAVRRTGLEQLGRRARQEGPALADAVAGRIQRLWEGRIAAARADAEAFAPELTTFGFFCDVVRLDDRWVLTKLPAVLELAGGVDAPHWVARRIARTAPTHPAEALAALDALADGQREQPWRLGTWLDDVRATIRAGYAAGPACRAAARASANRLARLGYVAEMRALLEELERDLP